MKRKVLSVLLLMFLGQAVYAGSKIEFFSIYNYSKNDIFISVKYRVNDKTETTFTSKGYGIESKSWVTYTSGVRLSARSYHFYMNNYRVSPGISIVTVNYDRYGIISKGKLIYPTDTISFMEKMNALFEELTIENAGGRVLVTMGNLWKQDIYKIKPGYIEYRLVILDEGADFDGIIRGEQYEKKPAWEWQGSHKEGGRN